MSKDNQNPRAIADDLREEEGLKKLVDWKNPPKLKDLKDDFSAAEGETTKQVGKVGIWLDALYGRGDYKAPEIVGRSKLVVRMIRKQIEWRCPSLTEPFLSNPKLFQVQPRTWEDKAAAEQNELILNYQFKNRMNPVKLMDDIVRTAATEGTAILRVFWKYKTDISIEEENEYEPVPAVDPALQQEIAELAAQVAEQPEMLDSLDEPQQLAVQNFIETGVPLTYNLVETKEVEVTKIIQNQPSAEVVPIEDVFVDPSCKGDFSRAKFLVYRFETCLAALKETGLYERLDELEEEIIANEQSTSKPDASGFKFNDVPRKTLEAHEYWGYYDIDGDGTLHSFVATWVGNVLIRMERNPYPDNGIPFVFIPLLPVKGSIYGEPDAELIKDNQQIMSATMRGAVDLFARSANGQTGIAKGFLDQGNLAKFNKGDNYSFNSNMDPRTAIHMHTFGEIPQSVFMMMNYLTNEADSFSGVKSFSNGVTGDSLGKTARGARTALDATAKRDGSILRRIAQGMVEAAYKFQTMNATFLTEQDVVRLTNAEYVRVDPDNLSGDFDLSIDISTAEADQQQIDTLSMLLQTGQQSFPLEFTQMILAQIAKLSRQPELEHYMKSYQPQPDPMQQKLQELEIAKVEAEIAEIQARTQEMLAKAAVNAAEVGVREARTENMQSNTDKNNITVLKDATGISQEEKLQLEEVKQRGKARDDLRKHDLTLQQRNADHNNELLRMGAQQDLDTSAYEQQVQKDIEAQQKIPMRDIN